MKKLLLLAAIVLTAAASFGRDVHNRKVQFAFDRAFAGANNVSWYELSDNYMAKFTLNSRKITAHFDRAGNLLATSRIISDAELPTQVINKLIRKYPNQKIHTIVEYAVEGSTYYALTIESGTHWTTLRADSFGEITMLTKLTKA
ncbi:hypothetical protein ACFOTA_08545 [Chitinophaga sp. GCM10012297]|uniref:Beta-lactamase-inhibitor-like PepSY-like domain-containing protein n=1 Tax=Chitinophaga chungangae TaxID=2821488 RepID=A0ABS3YC40_9BACT|nr:hypothetical protein [Chitinophaga chungangae]MBO9152252.1 hypothetical protein [Chitinophaga chungangae]